MEYNDEKTWKLFEEGKTKGVFQLESNLGKSWSKKLGPNNIEELSALIAIIRPGCLKAFVDGKSMSQHFIDRKHGREEVTYLHECLEEILLPTYGVLVYQEQSMRIAQKVAGFNLQEADELRKAIGKKKADLMAKVKTNFIKGAKKVGMVDKETAEEIFSWIEKSSRYAFNKSHSISYAVCSYWSAFQKAHNPEEFFLSYLYYANEKQDPHQEVYELLSDAKLFNIEARTPSLANFDLKFNVKKRKVYFGLKDIKSLTGKTGDKVVEGISTVQEERNKKINKFTWVEILLFFAPKVSSTAFKALASIGFFRDFDGKVTRNKALYDYDIYRTLTKAEQAWLQKNYDDRKWVGLVNALASLAPTKKEGGGTSKVARKQIVENEIQLLNSPPYSLDDDPSWVIDQETRFLGCPVSLSKIDTADTSAANTTCKEIVNGKKGKDLCVVGNIQRMSDYTITKGDSKGKTMSFLTIEDDTCVLDSVIIFPKVKDKYKYILYEGNNLIFCGSVDKKDSSLIINKIHEI
jgi:DNA polymerase III alpha subunit